MKSLMRVFSILILLLMFGSMVSLADDIPTGSEQVVVAADGVQVNLVQVIIGLLSAFAAGGIMGIAGLSIFVQRLQKDTPTVTALELLANSWPPQTRELLLQVSRGTKSIGELAEEVFDGKPIAEKLPQLE